MEKHNTVQDITFIGSGISTSFTIINYLKEISLAPRLYKKVSISIIEKYSEYNLGIPYGSRTGFSPLLITSLKNFLVEPELGLFIKWLNKNKEWLLVEFEKEGGILSKKWLFDNQEDIKNNKWEDLFIPRRFFGCYINLLVNEKVEKISKNNLININFINGEVIDIDKRDNNYSILLKNKNDIIHSKKIVLSVGSLPIKYLWKDNYLIEEKNLLFINNPYKPELSVGLSKITDFLKARHNKKTNILIIGANASGLELIYKINDIANLNENSTTFTCLSTQGKLPDAIIDYESQKHFIPKNLSNLKKSKRLTAKKIADAANKDLDIADKNDLGAATTVDIISNYFGVLLNKLNVKELEAFACYYGNEIGKRQRCAGLHYTDVIVNLENDNKFKHIAGRFNNLVASDNENYKLNYLDTLSKKEITTDEHFHLVINCGGSKNLLDANIPLLHKNLIKKGYCKVNKSLIGFDVNNSLETTKDLHIMGPLLAGNVIDNKAVWHVEHCGRIIWISKLLSKILLKDSIRTKEKINKEYELEVHNLENDYDINIYNNLLRNNYNNNIYYTYDHLKYFQNKGDTIKYFLFKIKNSKNILMPIILRQINLKGKKLSYFDSTTPYGYNGPLFENSVTEADLKEFWYQVDCWYAKNNVLTEFIRFSLNKNDKSYSGIVINSLLNVKGFLYQDFEEQWQSFLPKVRNNYRKAVSNNLNFKIYKGNEINEVVINQFFTIYTATMNRHNAKSVYFFSLNYFKELILNNTNEFSIAFSIINGITISTELIIKNKETIYAFLGGTDSNYYNVRPNDFLRVEVIKWAIKNNFKYYVLGGGLKDGDGLYKSKKCLFPLSDDVVFVTGRKIINNELYNKICKDYVEDYPNISKEDMNERFFPLYRNDNS